MENGRIAQAGKFEDLLQQNIGFEVLVGAHSQALESIVTAENSSRTIQTHERKKTESSNEDDSDVEATVETQLENCTRHESEQNLCAEINDKEGRILQDEEREKGRIGKEVYWAYLTTVRGGALVPVIIIAQSLFQVLQVASNYWMAWATPPTMELEPIVRTSVLFIVYILLSVGSSLCVFVRAMGVAIAGLLTSQKFFANMLHSVLHSPMSFFDSTPTGRILNRVSKYINL